MKFSDVTESIKVTIGGKAIPTQILLESAQQIRDGKTYSYQRGEASLLEVLNAQRTFNDIQENYQESLFAYASTLV